MKMLADASEPKIDWRLIPIPRRMTALQRDARGYPVPFIILRDANNKPAFTVNDDRRERRCLEERRCQICGTRLDRLMWFVGGPRSAFHERGAYADKAMHYECMRYAMRVCPYLAVPKYLGRIDLGGVDQEALLKAMNGCPIVLDSTQDPERPPLFVAVAAPAQAIQRRAIGPAIVSPVRPYEEVEFWRHGGRLTDEDGIAACETLELNPRSMIARYI